MRAWLSPLNLERRYMRLYRRTLLDVKLELFARLSPIIKLQTNQVIEDEYFVEARKTVSDQSDEIGIAIAAVLLWWRFRQSEVYLKTRIITRDVNIFNDNQFRLIIKDLSKLTIQPSNVVPYQPGSNISQYQDVINVFGENADIFRQEPYLDGIEKNFNSAQETHIDKTIKGVISDTELIVRNGIVTAAVSKTIRGAIDKKFETTTKRSERSAKEQVNTLDSVLAKNRQQSFNANEYLWDTQKDERVRGNPSGLYPRARPSHYARQNVIFSWNKPPEGGHPGEAEGCRCKAIMRLPR